MKTWNEVVKKALEMFLHKDDYAYFYGAKGQVLTDAVMEALWNAEPTYFSKYSSVQKKKIFDYSRGKIGIDCSGFTGICTGDKQWSRGQFDNCHDILTDVYAGPAGSILYTVGHIGLDIGYGFYLHAGRELNTIEFGRFKENTYHWTYSGKSNCVDYTGADNR